jgi:hypothetical protein
MADRLEGDSKLLRQVETQQRHPKTPGIAPERRGLGGPPVRRGDGTRKTQDAPRAPSSHSPHAVNARAGKSLKLRQYRARCFTKLSTCSSSGTRRSGMSRPSQRRQGNKVRRMATPTTPPMPSTKMGFFHTTGGGVSDLIIPQTAAESAGPRVRNVRWSVHVRSRYFSSRRLDRGEGPRGVRARNVIAYALRLAEPRIRRGSNHRDTWSSLFRCHARSFGNVRLGWAAQRGTTGPHENAPRWLRPVLDPQVLDQGS